MKGNNRFLQTITKKYDTWFSGKLSEILYVKSVRRRDVIVCIIHSVPQCGCSLENRMENHSLFELLFDVIILVILHADGATATCYITHHTVLVEKRDFSKDTSKDI